MFERVITLSFTSFSILKNLTYKICFIVCTPLQKLENYYFTVKNNRFSYKKTRISHSFLVKPGVEW